MPCSSDGPERPAKSCSTAIRGHAGDVGRLSDQSCIYQQIVKCGRYKVESEGRTWTKSDLRLAAFPEIPVQPKIPSRLPRPDLRTRDNALSVPVQ